MQGMAGHGRAWKGIGREVTLAVTNRCSPSSRVVSCLLCTQCTRGHCGLWAHAHASNRSLAADEWMGSTE